MATWQRLESEASELAGLGRMLLTQTNRAYLGTVRRDGAPRIHPICPVLSGARAYAVIINESRKYDDLRRDNRYALHAPLGMNDSEFWITGVAREIPFDEAARLAQADPRLSVPEGDTLFELTVMTAHGTIYSPGADGLAVPDRRSWRAEAPEVVR